MYIYFILKPCDIKDMHIVKTLFFFMRPSDFIYNTYFLIFYASSEWVAFYLRQSSTTFFICGVIIQFGAKTDLVPMLKSRERIVIRDNRFCKSKERIAGLNIITLFCNSTWSLVWFYLFFLLIWIGNTIYSRKTFEF